MPEVCSFGDNNKDEDDDDEGDAGAETNGPVGIGMYSNRFVLRSGDRPSRVCSIHR